MRVLLLALLVLVLAGCGSTSGTGGDDLGEAAEATTEAGSSRVEIVSSAASSGRLTMTGAFDYRAERGSLRLDWGARSTALAALPGEMTELRLVGKTLYTLWHIDQKTYWTKETNQRSADPVEVLVPAPGGTDPGDVLKLLVQASGGQTNLGRETLRGVETTHHRVEVDADKLIQQLPPEQRPETRDDEGDTRTFPLDVWIDEDNLVRRIRVEESLDPQQARARTTTTFDLFDFGVPVKVEEPPASEVLSEEEFDELFSEEVAAMSSTEVFESDCEGPLLNGEPRPPFCAELTQKCGKLRETDRREADRCIRAFMDRLENE